MSLSPGFRPDHLPSPEDLNAIIAFLPELYRAADMITFPVTSLRFINRLMPTAVFSTYNEIEMKTGSARVFYEPDTYTEAAELFKPGLWTHRNQHPLMKLHQEGRHNDVHMISDHLSRPELHRLELYTEVLQKMNVEDTLSFSLQNHRDLKTFYAINSDRPFTERDRAVARIIRPHLVQAFENVLAFTDARAMAALSAHVFRGGSHGLILADFSGRIIHASELASGHLAHLHTRNEPGSVPLAANENLPPQILSWLQRLGTSPQASALPLEIEMPGFSLIYRGAVVDERHWIIASQEQNIDALADALRDAYELSERQADVLLWISRGKSNVDIARILEISDRTVAKHIEHIFGKLGVENRLSATHKALAALGG